MSGSLPLLAAVAALFVGPILRELTKASPRYAAALNGVAVVTVAALCLLHLGPHAVATGGWPATGALVVGFAVPLLIHARLGGPTEHAWWLGRLGAHVAIDGAALSGVDPQVVPVMTLAVVAHRLPVGLLVAARTQSARSAAWVAAGLSALTALGFLAGAGSVTWLTQTVPGVLEGLVTGTLLHVGFANHAPTPLTQAETGTSRLGGLASPPATPRPEDAPR